MAWKGIDVRATGDRLVFRALIQDSAGAILTTGTTNLRLYEVQSDGTLKSYDFNDNTFKTTALTTETLAMTHRTGNNGTTNTGVWSAILTTLTGFTAGGIYIAHVSNSGAFPVVQGREFQFGSEQGDITVTAGRPEVDVTALNGVAASAANLERSASVIYRGTVDAGTTTTLDDSGLTQSGTGHWNGRIVIFTSGALAYQATLITGFDPANDRLTFDSLTAAPSASDTYVIV